MKKISFLLLSLSGIASTLSEKVDTFDSISQNVIGSQANQNSINENKDPKLYHDNSYKSTPFAQYLDSLNTQNTSPEISCRGRRCLGRRLRIRRRCKRRRHFAPTIRRVAPLRHYPIPVRRHVAPRRRLRGFNPKRLYVRAPRLSRFRVKRRIPHIRHYISPRRHLISSKRFSRHKGVLRYTPRIHRIAAPARIKPTSPVFRKKRRYIQRQRQNFDTSYLNDALPSFQVDPIGEIVRRSYRVPVIRREVRPTRGYRLNSIGIFDQIEAKISKIPINLTLKCLLDTIGKASKFRKCFINYCNSINACKNACYRKSDKLKCKSYRNTLMVNASRNTKYQLLCGISANQMKEFNKFRNARPGTNRCGNVLTPDEVKYISSKIVELARTGGADYANDFMINHNRYIKYLFKLKTKGHIISTKSIKMIHKAMITSAKNRITSSNILINNMGKPKFIRLARYITKLSKFINCPSCTASGRNRNVVLPNLSGLRLNSIKPRSGKQVVKTSTQNNAIRIMIIRTLKKVKVVNRKLLLQIINTIIRRARRVLKRRTTKNKELLSKLNDEIKQDTSKIKQLFDTLSKSVEPGLYDTLKKDVNNIQKAILKQIGRQRRITVRKLEKPIQNLVKLIIKSVPIQVRRDTIIVIRLKIQRIKILSILKRLNTKVPIKIRMTLLKRVLALIKQEKQIISTIRRRLRKKQFDALKKKTDLLEKSLKLSRLLKPRIPASIKQYVTNKINKVILRKIKIVPYKVRYLVRNIINMNIMLDKLKKSPKTAANIQSINELIEKIRKAKSKQEKIFKGKINPVKLNAIKDTIKKVGTDKYIKSKVGSEGINVKKVEDDLIKKVGAKLPEDAKINVRRLVLARIQTILWTKDLKKTYSDTPIGVRLSKAKDIAKNLKNEREIMRILKRTVGSAELKVIIEQMEYIIKRMRRRRVRAKPVGPVAKVELKKDINNLVSKVPAAVQAEVKKIIDSRIQKAAVNAGIKKVGNNNPISNQIKLTNKLDRLADKQTKPIQNLKDKISPKQLEDVKKALSNIKSVVVNKNLANINELKVLPSELNRKINESLHNIKNIAPEIPKKVLKKLIKNNAKLDRLKKFVEKLRNTNPKAIADKINNKLDKARNNQRNAIDNLRGKFGDKTAEKIENKINKIAKMANKLPKHKKRSERKKAKKIIKKMIKKIIKRLPKDSRADAKKAIKTSIKMKLLKEKLKKLAKFDPKKLA
ncbi:hypothetical protein AYI69_g6622, partial [Smittium culicis]